MKKKRRTKKQFLHALENGGTFPVTNQEVKWFEKATKNIITKEPPSFEEFEAFRKKRETQKYNYNKFPFKNHVVGI
jgi:hypothetical protein